MDLNWWHDAKGTMTHNSNEFQNLVEAAGPDTFIVVDFFMPACHYCVKFMPEWNKIVDEFTAEYGSDKIKFVKVDGTKDRWTGDRYSIDSYPSFIILQPGSFGDQFHHWRPQHRDYQGMKYWIKTFAGDRLKPLAAANGAGDAAAKENHKPFVLPPPVAALTNPNNKNGAIGTAQLLETQIEEEKRLADAVENMITQQ